MEISHTTSLTMRDSIKILVHLFNNKKIYNKVFVCRHASIVNVNIQLRNFKTKQQLTKEKNQGLLRETTALKGKRSKKQKSTRSNYLKTKCQFNQQWTVPALPLK